MDQRIEKPYLLIVEGKEDRAFFSAYLRHQRITNIQIFETEGKGKHKVRAFFRLLTQLSGFDDVHGIGIIRDSDGNPTGAFDSVCSALDIIDLPVPKKVGHLSDGSPKTSVLILPPNNEGTGRMLEDLCLEATKDDPAFKCIETYFDCLTHEEIEHKDKDIAKAWIHAYIASRPEPDLRLGEAAQKGYFDFDHPVFEPIKAFLTTLSTQ